MLNLPDLPPCWAVICRFDPFWVQGGRFHCEVSGKKCVFYRLRGPGQPRTTRTMVHVGQKSLVLRAPLLVPSICQPIPFPWPTPNRRWVELRRACQHVLSKKNSSPCNRRTTHGFQVAEIRLCIPVLPPGYPHCPGQVIWISFSLCKRGTSSQIFRLSED